MTINEVQALQETRRTSSTAMGGLQFLKTPLSEVKQKLHLRGDEIFDKDMQTKMGIARLYQNRRYRDFLAGRISPETFLKGLSQEFASVENPETGLSSHGQPVKTSKADMLPTLEALQRDFAP